MNPQAAPAGWSWLVAGASAVVIIAGLRAGASLLLPVLVAGFLALVAYPLVGWLQRRRVPTPLAVVATMAATLVVMAGPGLVVHGAAVQFAVAAPDYRRRLEEMTSAALAWLQAQGIEVAEWPAFIDSAHVVDLASYMVAGVAALLSNLLLVLLVLAFILMEAAGFSAKLAGAFNAGPAGVERMSRVVREVHRYLWVKTAVSLATGLLIGLWAATLGVDFAVLWGLLAFLLNYIPNFGSILAAVPAVLLALVQLGPGTAFLLLVGYLAVNTVLGNIVEPHLMGRRLQLSPLVILLSLVFWGWVWGPVGMLLSVPLTMVARILFENSPDLRWVAVLLADGRVRPPDRRP